MQEGQLRRSALGRIAFIGELYDARRESFSSRSLLRNTSPPNLIECRNVGNTEFDYRFTNSTCEKFNLLKVQAELQLSVLLGLVSVSGSGTFLTEEEESEKSVCCSLVCSISTVCEKFFAPFADILQHIDLNALEDLEYTHVVTEINWGANCLLHLVATAASKFEKEQIKGQLSGKVEMFKKLLSVQGGGDLEKTQFILENTEDLRIKVWADVVPDGGWPTSTEGFAQFVMEVPKLLKNENMGKGKPLNYVMTSLNTFRRLAKLSSDIQVTVKSIDESFLISTVYLLEDIALLKRNLHDLIAEMARWRKYIKNPDFELAKNHHTNLGVKETELKLLISEQWVRVRSGEKTLNELMREVENFKNRSLSLFTYHDYLESTHEIHKKLAAIKNYISHGVLYLGEGDTFESILSQNLHCEFFVLLMPSQTEEEDSELHIETTHYFLTEASDPRPNTKYVVVDFDLQRDHTFMNASVSKTRIIHLKGSNILSKDKYAEHKADLVSNFVRAEKGAEVVTHKPGNRVPFEMICPGFQKGTCPSDVLSWTCFRCKKSIEYGFDEFFYCSCGKGQVSDMTYRCSHPNHGNSFVGSSMDFVRKKLSSLKPLKEMNVLILGCSGVGKSTWINSIINYLSHETLDIAKEHGVICTIPASFVLSDLGSSKKTYIVNIGEENKNEVTEFGHSATQVAHTYSFIWKGRCVRLIDTPGLGDTRGLDQDKRNLKNIVHHIGHLEELHGVCILFKANDNRANAIFSYCLKELLVHLHKSVTKNIVFCITNARNSFYSPGQISVVLEKLIHELGAEKELLPLGCHNMFCLDNEAFIFLCSLSNPEITYPPHIIESFRYSWKLSLDETTRLFETIYSFEPHKLKDTLSLLTVRNRIMNLAKPIAEISKTIQINVSALSSQREVGMAKDQTVEELSKKLNFTEIRLESIPLDYPRTVCTSPSCVDYVNFESVDVKAIEYKTICHDRCYLANVETQTVNNHALRRCDAMDSDGICNKCKCSWAKHMHITYIQKRVETQRINKSVEDKIKQEKNEKEEVESIIRNLEILIEKYKKEQEFTIQASVKFGMFLKRNAITLYNDSVAKYMEYLIEEEENKPHQSRTEKNLVVQLKQMLDHYNAEVNILTEVLKKGENNQEELSTEQVLELEQQLYQLELTGEEIRRSAECSLFTNEKMMQYAETSLQISQNPETRRLQYTSTDQNQNKTQNKGLFQWVKDKANKLYGK